jgi:hypothetical protein
VRELPSPRANHASLYLFGSAGTRPQGLYMVAISMGWIRSPRARAEGKGGGMTNNLQTQGAQRPNQRSSRAQVKPPPITRYRGVRPLVVSFLADLRRDVEVLVNAERMFEQRSHDSSLGTLRQDDARQSIEVLHSVQAMQNKIGSSRFTAAPQIQGQLLVSGVIVSVRLDLFVHGASNGRRKCRY